MRIGQNQSGMHGARATKMPRDRRRAFGFASVAVLALGPAFFPADAASDDPKAGAMQVPAHVAAEHQQASDVPVDAAATRAAHARDPARWWAPGERRTFPARLSYDNDAGSVTTLSLAGPTQTDDHPFFTALGSNGRACVSCHQPADGMSLSVATIKARWQQTGGNDPLFAAVDGSNCPSLPQAQASSHSLLLERGLFRVFRPWPPKPSFAGPVTPQFSIEVVRDPTGCNTDPRYGLHARNPMISVYRRPRPATNLKFSTAAEFAFEPKTGLPLLIDPATSQPISGNLMADARNSSLPMQATEALLTHLQASPRQAPATLQRILEFESQLISAQSRDRWGSPLTAAGARGGPRALSEARAGELQSASSNPIWNEFQSWATLPEVPTAGAAAHAQREFRASVARGAELFVKRTFLIWDTAGVTSMGFGNPVRNSCAFCHNMAHAGLDVAPGQVDLGTVNEPFADPAPELPLFKLTCDARYPPHPHQGRVVYTHDPGYALTTGKCIDIGKITTQPMRALGARAPYFSNGSAATLRAVVDFYERRYAIGLTEREKQDLTNLMSVL
jgi:hypothetical protein